MEFKTVLKELRTKHNLTQKQLAEKIGVASQSISDWEKGRSEPNLDKIKNLARCFNVRIGQMLGFEKLLS
ncbi:MAG: helix-turn-helix domain-containing protein [Firmicutes bacterium]|nr:helix-turn-helix domain-containing protein [Bacillota bacterium]